jgi:hypothetical protein
VRSHIAGPDSNVCDLYAVDLTQHLHAQVRWCSRTGAKCQVPSCNPVRNKSRTMHEDVQRSCIQGVAAKRRTVAQSKSNCRVLIVAGRLRPDRCCNASEGPRQLHGPQQHMRTSTPWPNLADNGVYSYCYRAEHFPDFTCVLHAPNRCIHPQASHFSRPLHMRGVTSIARAAVAPAATTGLSVTQLTPPACHLVRPV